MADLDKIESSEPYRIYDRATVKANPPVSVDIADGPTTPPSQKPRVNPDPSGT